MEARLNVRALHVPIAALLLLIGGCDQRKAATPNDNESKVVTIDVPRTVEAVAGVTPMAERVAVLGLLNKRNGIVRDIRLRPGQAIRFRDAVVLSLIHI